MTDGSPAMLRLRPDSCVNADVGLLTLNSLTLSDDCSGLCILPLTLSPSYTHTHGYTPRHTHTYTDTHRYTRTHTYRRTLTHLHKAHLHKIVTHKDRHIHSYILTDKIIKGTQIQTYTETQLHRHTLLHTDTPLHTETHLDTDTHSHTYTHTRKPGEVCVGFYKTMCLETTYYGF